MSHFIHYVSEVGILHLDELADGLSRISRSDNAEDGASLALLCTLSDGGSHQIKLKTGNSTSITDGRLYVCTMRNNQYNNCFTFVSL